MADLPTSRYWRPRVGDRVRVQIHADRDCLEYPHLLGEAARIGQVVGDTPVPGAQSHPYLVVFECASTCGVRSGQCVDLPARHYAADELAPA